GELKTKTWPLVETFYGFESGHNCKIIVHNHQIAEELKEGHTFITNAELVQHKGLYQLKLIQKVVNTMWFRNKQDKGISYSFYFNPFTIPALTLILTANQDQHPLYHHTLSCFEKHTEKHGILNNILLKLYNWGRFHSGAQQLSTADHPTISDDVFVAALKQYIDESETKTDGERGDSD
ncbi:hypothetical protein L208DRAFT_1269313, partial [Tricholoma matsutake]